jgi:hypothetical protein
MAEDLGPVCSGDIGALLLRVCKYGDDLNILTSLRQVGNAKQSPVVPMIEPKREYAFGLANGARPGVEDKATGRLRRLP